jgi:hypothetical protein
MGGCRIVPLQGSSQAGCATFNVAADEACGDSHHKGNLGVGQARVVPQDQCFALPRWKGVKDRHEKGVRGGDVRLSSLGRA